MSGGQPIGSASLKRSFEIDLGVNIIPSCVTLGKFDGKHPFLAAAMPGSQVIVHAPHAVSTGETSTTRVLSVNRSVQALACAPIASDGRDCLLIGSQTALQAFDVHDNTDLFFRDAPDGVGALAVLPETNTIVSGGNCSVQGYTAKGDDDFWTVAGDEVGCLEAIDMDHKGSKKQLLVGSNDATIRVFESDEMTAEYDETAPVTSLVAICPGRFAYSLANGTVGVYEGEHRLWRVKTKHKAVGLQVMDANNDGMDELIIAWDSGKVEVRDIGRGTLLFKDQLGGTIAGLLVADYRMDGSKQALFVMVDGKIKGYTVAQTGSSLEDAEEEEVRQQEVRLKELHDARDALYSKLRTLDTQLEENKSGKIGASGGTRTHIPADTEVNCQWAVNHTAKCVDLVVSTNNDTVVSMVAVFADQVFDGESLLIRAETPESRLNIPIVTDKAVGANLFLKIFVGQRNASVYHMFEQGFKLPKFSMFVPDEKRPEPQGHVSFGAPTDMQRMQLWLSTSFNISINSPSTTSALTLPFKSIRDKLALTVVAKPSESPGVVDVKFAIDDMAVAASLVQDLSQFLGVKELHSTASFPEEMQKLQSILVQVEEFNSARVRLSAEMADVSNVAKGIIVRAEDLRLLGNMEGARDSYVELHARNQELLIEHSKRTSNHQSLLGALKEVNKYIQKASQLRVGPVSKKIIAACRQCIQSNDTAKLADIMMQTR